MKDRATTINVSTKVYRGGSDLVITTDGVQYKVGLTDEVKLALARAIFGSGAVSKQLPATTVGEE